MSEFSLKLLHGMVVENPSFGGYILRGTDVESAKKLAKVLRKSGIKVKRTRGYVWAERA